MILIAILVLVAAVLVWPRKQPSVAPTPKAVGEAEALQAQVSSYQALVHYRLKCGYRPIFLAGQEYCSHKVVGTSFHQAALKILREGKTDPHFDAMLEPEPDNPHDEQAVKIVISGLEVGHLSREDARTFHGVFADVPIERRWATCRAYIGESEDETDDFYFARLGCAWPPRRIPDPVS